MRRILVLAAVALAFGGLATADEGQPLPWVGVLKAVDVESRVATVLGPDGQELQVVLPKKLLEEGAGRLEYAKLPEKIGKYMGLFLRDESHAHLAVVVDALSEPIPVVIRGSRPTFQQVEVLGEMAMNMRYKPAVNLGASVVEGEPPVRASWEWFNKNRKKTAKIQVITINSIEYLYSVSPWTTTQEALKKMMGRE